MGWSTWIEITDDGEEVKKGQKGYEIRLCDCDVYAMALMRGSKMDFETGRRIPVNKWMCEQCIENARDMDDAEIRVAKRQRISSEAHAAFELWYEKYAQ